jgi:hypothetical protein
VPDQIDRASLARLHADARRGDEHVAQLRIEDLAVDLEAGHAVEPEVVVLISGLAKSAIVALAVIVGAEGAAERDGGLERRVEDIGGAQIDRIAGDVAPLRITEDRGRLKLVFDLVRQLADGLDAEKQQILVIPAVGAVERVGAGLAVLADRAVAVEVDVGRLVPAVVGMEDVGGEPILLRDRRLDAPGARAPDGARAVELFVPDPLARILEIGASDDEGEAGGGVSAPGEMMRI